MEAFEQAALLTWLVCEVDLPQIVQASVTGRKLLIKLFDGELHICY